MSGKPIFTSRRVLRWFFLVCLFFISASMKAMSSLGVKTNTDMSHTTSSGPRPSLVPAQGSGGETASRPRPGWSFCTEEQQRVEEEEEEEEEFALCD